MSMNIYFSPIKVHFKPLPEFTISPQWFAKNISKNISWLLNCGFKDKDKISLIAANIVITSLACGAFIDSYLFSPNVLIPLAISDVLYFASSSSPSGIAKVVNVIFSTAVLGLISKYTHDGTLGKLSNDLYSLFQQAKKTSKQLNHNIGKHDFKSVTFYEPHQIPDNAKQMGCIRSIISFINSIFLKIFEFFFFYEENSSNAEPIA